MWNHGLTVSPFSHDTLVLIVNGNKINANKYVFEKLCPDFVQSYYDDKTQDNRHEIEINIPHLSNCDLVKEVFSIDGVTLTSKNALNILMIAQNLGISSLESCAINFLNGYMEETDSKLSRQNTPTKPTTNRSNKIEVDKNNSNTSQNSFPDIDEYLDNIMELETLFLNLCKDNMSNLINEVERFSTIFGCEEVCRTFIFSAVSRVKNMDEYLKFYNLYKNIKSDFTQKMVNELKHIFINYDYYNIHRQVINEVAFIVKYISDIDDIKFDIKLQNSTMPSILLTNEKLFHDKSQIIFSEDSDNIMPLFIIFKDDNLDTLIEQYGYYITQNYIFVNNHSDNHRNPFYYLKNTSNLLEYAAFFGAEKCFKYIYSQHSYNEIIFNPKYAIAGGNYCVIKMVEDMGFDLSQYWKDAIFFKHIEVFEWIITHKLKNTDFDEKNITIIAFIYHNIGVINYLIKENIICDSFFYYTVLLKCTKLSDWFLNQEFINERNSINFKGSRGYTPLILAVCNNIPKLVEILLKHRWIITDAKYDNTYSAFQIACLLQNTKIIELFLKYGNENLMENLPNNLITPIEYGIQNRNIHMVRILFDHLKLHDLDPNVLGKCFFLFCLEGDEKYFNKILEYDDTNITYRMNGMTAIHAAVLNNHINIVKKLRFLHGNFVNQKDDVGQTPLHIAALNNCEEITTLFLKNDEIDVNIKDDNGETPLFSAIRSNSVNIAKLLLENGADFKIYNDDIIAPIHLTAKIGSVEMLELLLSYDPSQMLYKSGEGVLPIMYTINNPNYYIIKLILEKYPSELRNCLHYPNRKVEFIIQNYYFQKEKLY
ncbi:hypothetical protein TRFO_41304 [Tritrichomonas foetus]|uniref:Uncharacterized protein n=1 Tax=Tritrichomonas foetus TaxID=1144522 RepID=A0A1J4L0Z3_9EUKA|nr:hypothetical protein TRFO_41304 [Tritrichomonas foetus]|eukprot:OHT17082.1 hypothetical protein TRFO_41304 [Tritrichomonas foetus]